MQINVAHKYKRHEVFECTECGKVNQEFGNKDAYTATFLLRIGAGNILHLVCTNCDSMLGTIHLEDINFL